MKFSRPEYWNGEPYPPPGDFPTQGSNPGVPNCRFLPDGSPGKPKNTGVGSLSLLQWIFPIQESNQGLLHCRRILYQLSYQGSQGSSPHPPHWNCGALTTGLPRKSLPSVLSLVSLPVCVSPGRGSRSRQGKPCATMQI